MNSIRKLKRLQNGGAMYAIIKTGGKQYKVQAGDVLQVEKLENDLGSEFTINEVLMIGGDTPSIGSPLVKDASVTCVVTKQAKTRKVIVFKKKRRQSYRRFGTHKQNFTEIYIKAISVGGKTTKAENEQPEVKDMAALRLARIQTKIADSRARAEANIGVNKAAKTEAPKAAKKAVKKAPAKKKVAAKKAVAKKAPSKRSAKTAAKKATKKTTKKTK